MTEQKRHTGIGIRRGSDERQRRFISQRYGGNYLALVVGLILIFILVAAFASQAKDSRANEFVIFLFYATMLAGFRGTTRKVERNAAFGIAVIIGVILAVIATLFSVQPLDQLSSIYRALLGVILMVLVLRDIVVDDRVTVDTIVGSIGAYILYALFWASVYVAFERGNSDSFNIPDPSGSSFADLLYFSVVTQTTLGYGDITPVEPVTRQLASLQALTGQLYVAILVAWLVGVATAQYLDARSRARDRDD